MNNRNENELFPHSVTISDKLIEKEKVQDLILKSLLGLHASESLYTISRCQWANNPVSVTVFLPKDQCSKDLPPVVFVVQSIINVDFMEDLIKYSLSLYEEYKILPTILIFSTGGFSDEEIKSKFKVDNNSFMMETNCDFWENHCYVLCKEFIDGFINEHPMQQFIALTYCIIDTENSLHSNDPIINFFHNLAKQ
ncbi:hypothetical protein BDF21DRAFT_468028 [Thamnidium elegans]|uniref:Uncharacterized protein n=1 Tax=Thamnidium elegans TaxID=101142 RepID=A0A8H7SXI7_9FUNG|nr:hypothetical protein INT48_008625 [Thamnidium elegans]KAI8056476.1 hypothetical protein BDF21DRAFT_468028 [Thamnidium elegans]